MRWKVKQKQTKPIRPVVGDIRTRIRFAIFPKRMNDTIIWLERYWVREELRLTLRAPDMVDIGTDCFVSRVLHYVYNLNHNTKIYGIKSQSSIWKVMTNSEYLTYLKASYTTCPNCSTMQGQSKDNICRWCKHKTEQVKDAVDKGIITLKERS